MATVAEAFKEPPSPQSQFDAAPASNQQWFVKPTEALFSWFRVLSMKSLSPPRSMPFILLAIALAGCLSSPPDPTSPDDLQHFQATVDLQILDDALRPDGIPNSDGLVFANVEDCVFFSPESEDETWQLTNGTFVLEWDDSDGSEMNISIGANDLDSWIYGPMGPSPRVLDLPSVNATWEFPVLVIVHGDLAVGEITKDATAHIRFSYTGDEPWVFRSNC